MELRFKCEKTSRKGWAGAPAKSKMVLVQDVKGGDMPPMRITIVDNYRGEPFIREGEMVTLSFGYTK